jgi:hypothetical protein
MTKGPRINYKKLENNWERLIRFDEIRFFKLVEIAYYSIISFFLAIILGPLLNILTPKLNDEIALGFVISMILFGSQKRLNQNIVKIENFIEKKIFNFLKKKDQTDEENKDI